MNRPNVLVELPDYARQVVASLARVDQKKAKVLHRYYSDALGTGDLDCVYYMVLYELGESVEEVGDETLSEMFDLLVDGKRVRDISDLPFDLAI
jgi:hypothetical protein